MHPFEPTHANPSHADWVAELTRTRTKKEVIHMLYDAIDIECTVTTINPEDRIIKIIREQLAEHGKGRFLEFDPLFRHYKFSILKYKVPDMFKVLRDFALKEHDCTPAHFSSYDDRPYLDPWETEDTGVVKCTVEFKPEYPVSSRAMQIITDGSPQMIKARQENERCRYRGYL